MRRLTCSTCTCTACTRDELRARLEAVERRMEEVRGLGDDKLFLDRCLGRFHDQVHRDLHNDLDLRRFYGDFDWDRISVTNFGSTHTPRECELQWRNLVGPGPGPGVQVQVQVSRCRCRWCTMSQVHPDINRGVWSATEDALLKRLAEATEGQDWDSVARWVEGLMVRWSAGLVVRWSGGLVVR